MLCAPSCGWSRFSVCMRLTVPCALLPTLLPADSHQLRSLSSRLWALSLRKSSKAHLKDKCKSFNPHPETKHPSLCCHKQANVKSLSGKLSEGNKLMMKTFCSRQHLVMMQAGLPYLQRLQPSKSRLSPGPSERICTEATGNQGRGDMPRSELRCALRLCVPHKSPRKLAMFRQR